MSLVMEDGVTATTVTTKDGIERQVDFVIIAREDVKERVINALLVDCKEFINITPKQPVTALGQLARSVSDKLPTELQNRLPSFLRRSGQ
jgi:hypothetical protein